jgi:molybdate transport system substrate-binding protein
MNKKVLLLLLLFSLGLEARPTLRFFCGVTMASAMLEAKQAFEQKHHCTITIIQGGSKNLCKSIETTHSGDLFLPGESSYIDRCGEEGYVLYKKEVGFNRLAIFVPKGNPKGIKNLNDLLRKDLLTTLGNPDTCSIGKMAEETLLRYGGGLFLNRVKYNLGLYAADSRDMIRMLVRGEADVGLSGVATHNTPMIRQKSDIIPICDLYAQPQNLVIAVLRFSDHPKLAQAFVDYLTSSSGLEIMKRYGFDRE